MTLLDWYLLPTGAGVVALLLLATFYRNNYASIGVALASLLGSFMLMANPYGQLVLIAGMAVLLFVSMRPMQHLEEFSILLLCSVLGGIAAVEGQNFIYVLLGIELLTIPVYGLIAFDRDRTRGIDASIKYLVLGGLSSALMLFGVALNYSISLDFGFDFRSEIGAALFLAGLCFKLSLAPFHFWTPDVYEGAPVAVTAFLATASKVAVIGVLARLSMPASIMQIVTMVAMLSMLVGSLLTLRSDRMGRFLAYSSIAHMGYVLVTWSVHGNLVLYASAYMLSVLIIFWMLSWIFEPSQELLLLGLFYRRPLPTVLMIFGLLSLMGLPMTPIFWAKYQVLIATLSVGSISLFGVFVLSSLISVYGYARIVTRMCQRI